MAVTTDCTEDYVEIRDGSTLESPLIRRYCSSNIFSVAGRTNHLLLRVLNTGTSPPYLSFTAEYFAYDLENARLNSTVGTYSSPRYQGTASLGYPNNLDFTITIESPAETGLILVFTEFILQEKSGTKCFDFIEVSEPDGTILGTFCGATPPQDIVTRYNTVYIRFKTNPVTTFAGFTVTWETCGDHFTQSNGIMTIPTRQSYYRNNMNCHYLFTEPPGKKVVLTFTEIIRIEDIVNGHCVDYIQLFEGGHDSTDTIYLGCATINPFSIASRGNEMLLKFVSDTRVTNTGFTLSYKAVDICRYKYDTMGGTIQSPNYNGQYSANEHCEFEIETTPLSQILVHYDKFLLESKDPECHDYLQIVDPMAPTVKTQSYCARNTPPSAPYTGHELRMKFVSDDRIQYDGFVAYWAACGGLHREHQGMIKAPYNYVITGWSQTCVHTIMPDQFDKIYLMMKVTSTLQGTCTESVQENEDLRRQVDALDQYNRRNSLHVTGLKEEADETTEKILVRELSKVGLEISPSDIDDSYRIGSAQGGRTRPIIVKFSSYRAKRRILVARRNLPKGVYVNDDLTSERSSIAYKARQLVKQRILNKTWISNGKIMVIDRLNRKHAIDTHANLELLASPSYITKNTTTHLHVPQSPGISYAGIVSGITSVQIPSLEGAVAASVTTGTVTTPATV
ncbi:hypothetical protein FSP39_009022 [Pinctada imbricata]|uniref:CUB domain-containing protein n=1 Tax=Pinctada imbricata TaxID=66713 RepID=A0AA89CCM0_PINIB|nr:hypothetical protein FSP39_009022 [Pinctada imbricata]